MVSQAQEMTDQPENPKPKKTLLTTISREFKQRLNGTATVGPSDDKVCEKVDIKNVGITVLDKHWDLLQQSVVYPASPSYEARWLGNDTSDPAELERSTYTGFLLMCVKCACGHWFMSDVILKGESDDNDQNNVMNSGATAGFLESWFKHFPRCMTAEKSTVQMQRQIPMFGKCHEFTTSCSDEQKPIWLEVHVRSEWKNCLVKFSTAKLDTKLAIAHCKNSIGKTCSANRSLDRHENDEPK